MKRACRRPKPKRRLPRHGGEREAILLQARSRETDIAKAQADQSAAQADSARAQADTAKAQLAETQQKLADLQAKQTDRGMVLTLGDVLFDTGQATLKPGATTILDRVARFMAENPQTNVRIEGHTDSTGTSDFNEALSQHRAEAAAETLETRGCRGQSHHRGWQGSGNARRHQFDLCWSTTEPAGRNRVLRLKRPFRDGELTPQSTYLMSPEGPGSDAVRAGFFVVDSTLTSRAPSMGKGVHMQSSMRGSHMVVGVLLSVACFSAACAQSPSPFQAAAEKAKSAARAAAAKFHDAAITAGEEAKKAAGAVAGAAADAAGKARGAAAIATTKAGAAMTKQAMTCRQQARRGAILPPVQPSQPQGGRSVFLPMHWLLPEIQANPDFRAPAMRSPSPPLGRRKAPPPTRRRPLPMHSLPPGIQASPDFRAPAMRSPPRPPGRRKARLPTRRRPLPMHSLLAGILVNPDSPAPAMRSPPRPPGRRKARLPTRRRPLPMHSLLAGILVNPDSPAPATHSLPPTTGKAKGAAANAKTTDATAASAGDTGKSGLSGSGNAF